MMKVASRVLYMTSTQLRAVNYLLMI